MFSGRGERKTGNGRNSLEKGENANMFLKASFLRVVKKLGLCGKELTNYQTTKFQSGPN